MVLAVNFVFWIIATLLSIAAALQWWSSSQQTENTDAQKISSFARDDRWPLEDGTWSIDEVDFLATAERIRAVVTLVIEESDDVRRRQAMEFLAHEIYRQVEVEAVFIEAYGHPEGVASYLFAADGRGWWGREIISTAFRSGP